MTSETLFSNHTAYIHYFSELNALHLELLGRVESSDYKEVFSQLLVLINEKNASYLITDQTKSKGASMDSRAWLVVKWLPELRATIGDKDFTILGVSEAKFGMKKFISQYLEQTFKKLAPFPIEVFETVKLALAWIKNKKGI